MLTGARHACPASENRRRGDDGDIRVESVSNRLVRTMVIGGMAVAVAIAIAAMVGVTETLPSDVLVALSAGGQDNRDDFMTVCFRATDSIVGMRMVLLSLLLGGAPAAILAAWLRRSRPDRPWPAAWAIVFLAGFVFQLSSLVFTSSLLIAVLGTAYVLVNDRMAIMVTAEALLLSAACSMLGLRSWRALQLHVREPPVTIRWVDTDQMSCEH